ncbi:MAG: hypothetical protein ABW199_03975 [Caulobacterales bacterium]
MFDPAVLAAAGIGIAILLAILMHVMEPPRRIARGDGALVHVMAGDDSVRTARAIARVLDDGFRVETHPRADARPILVAFGRAAGKAFKPAENKPARALVLIDPQIKTMAPADTLFPPVVILAPEHKRVAALKAALPRAELIAAPAFARSPQKQRLQLIAQAVRRAARMAEDAGEG